MKESIFRGSILNGSDKLVSESHSNWNTIRPGSLIKFSEDESVYVAGQISNSIYIKDFYKGEKNNIIYIKDNSSINLIKGDTLTISYKEYEISAINKLTSAGQNYRNGDTLILDGGVPSFNMVDGLREEGKVKVIEASSNGGILNYSLDNKGKYIEVPAGECKVSGGFGNGAVFDIQYKLIDSRTIIERDIESVEVGDITKIILQYDLPATIKEGKLSCNKSVLRLNSIYTGQNKVGASFSIARDFTMNYHWPLPINNSFSLNSIITQVLHLQDRKIRELEDRIKQLETKL